MIYYILLNDDIRYYYDNIKDLAKIKNKSLVVKLEFVACKLFKLELPYLSEFVNLEELCCNYNNFTKLPYLSCLSNLINLNLSDNQLSELPDLSNCINLIDLDCSNNNLLELPDLSNCINLNSLCCQKNNLIKLPDLSNCINLTYLKCSVNKLTVLPDLTNLIYLDYLNICSNYIFELPFLPINLKTLLCSYNINLNEITNLSLNLETIYCTDNNLTKFPDLSKCSNLKNFVCYNNNFKEIHKGILQCNKLLYKKKYNKYKYIDKLSNVLNYSIEKYYYSVILKYYTRLYI